MDRSVDAEVVASTFDEQVTSHVRAAEIALTGRGDWLKWAGMWLY